jgi:16S rRNA (cytosine1402-N4)-methyltransferase
MDFRHLSVMPQEVVKFLSPRPGGIYVDGTLGGAGHAALILEASKPDGRLIGFDRDRDAQVVAQERLATYKGRTDFVGRNFAEIADGLAELGVDAVDGLLLDLGVSSFQLDSADRGFSFQQDASLDMRMDRSTGKTAADLVNTLSEGELEWIIREYGEERWARKIARRIVATRADAPIETTLQLADLIGRTIPRGAREERINPATRTFQALRIAVNDELASLQRCLADVLPLLRSGGRVVVISFHSLEDRMVKQFFRDQATTCICPKDLPVCACNKVPQLRILTGKAVVAGDEEVSVNPRARSARLRAAEKC